MEGSLLGFIEQSRLDIILTRTMDGLAEIHFFIDAMVGRVLSSTLSFARVVAIVKMQIDRVVGKSIFKNH